jgi:hypothetical protein
VRAESVMVPSDRVLAKLPNAYRPLRNVESNSLEPHGKVLGQTIAYWTLTGYLRIRDAWGGDGSCKLRNGPEGA